MKIAIGVIIGFVLGYFVNARATQYSYYCPNAIWTGPVELTDFNKKIEFGFCADGLVSWRLLANTMARERHKAVNE